MSLEKMITIVKKIHHDYNTNPSLFNKNREKYIKELERNNPGLSRTYSSIFRMFKGEEIDNEKINRLHYMLKMSQKVKEGKVDSDKADQSVGKVLADKIVIPQIERVRKENNK